MKMKIKMKTKIETKMEAGAHRGRGAGRPGAPETRGMPETLGMHGMLGRLRMSGAPRMPGRPGKTAKAGRAGFCVAALLLCCALGLFACDGGGATAPARQASGSAYAAPAAAVQAPEDLPAGDEILRIYCWNTEFQDRFNAYYLESLPAALRIEWVITPNDGNAYQNRLDADLAGNADADDPIDIFLIEADYAMKYVDTAYTLDVVGDVGLSEADLADQYDYTKRIATDSGGRLKAVSWQATPGLFAYRRSIAKDVLGTDDPEQVQALLSDWEKFDAVAARMSEKGYRMLSGFDDAYRVFSNNVERPWVDASNRIVIDDNLMRWVEQTKRYTELGYHNGTRLWDAAWSADQGPGGMVFGFFYSTWGINFTLLENALADPSAAQAVGNGIFGDYAVCEGPQHYYWGGTWICAAAGGDNVDTVREVMHALACDAEIMQRMTRDTEDYANNRAAMDAIAGDPEYGSALLGGQNHIALFADAAPLIDMRNAGPYDQGLNESFQAAMVEYFAGEASLDAALRNFRADAARKYPDLAAGSG